MLDIPTILTAIIVIIACYWMYRKKKIFSIFNEDDEPLIEPPCMPWIPIFGSLPFLPPFPKMYKYFTKHATGKYKDVAAYYVLNKYRVVLNSREAILEAFVKRSPDFADRPIGVINEILNPNQKGILFRQYNEEFKKYHKLSLGIMKQYGFGNRIMEKGILAEISVLLESFRQFKGETFNPSPMLLKCSMNVICTLLFGKRFDDNDPNLDAIITNMRASFKNLPKIFIINIYPFLRYISFVKNAMANSLKAQEKIFDMLEGKIKECMDDAVEYQSFIRSYIETEGRDYDKLQLLHFMHELFLAGSETTGSTLEWLLVLLGNNMEVQEKMFAEMTKIEDGMPSLLDKKSLPYCEAVFYEILRMKPATPLTLPRVTMKDSHVLGYFIPEKTYVIANLHAVHHNPDVWGDPGKFRPNRFLKNDALDNSVRDLLLPFSIGKRSCLGEILAKQEIFLAMTNIVRKFLILPPVGKKEIKVKDVMDVTSKPSSFKIRLIER